MQKPKILLVDDEAVFARNMVKLLCHRGYAASAVNRGADAVRILSRERFDVIVLDLKMPGMDGPSTLKEIRRLDPEAHTLILTGHGSVDSAREALRLGAFDYLTKPCGIDELVEKIESAGKPRGEPEQEPRG